MGETGLTYAAWIMGGARMTIPEMFARRVRETPDGVAFILPSADGRRQVSWGEVEAETAARRGAIRSAGLSPGDRVAILAPNGLDWVACDLAAMAEGLITVPLHLQSDPATLAHVLDDSGARLCIADSAARWRAATGGQPVAPRLEAVWTLDGSRDAGEPRLAPFSAHGAAADGAETPSDPDAVATLIYTSGTTAKPKGVMMTHAALLWNAAAVSSVNPPERSDLLLSILPLAHSFERVVGLLAPMMAGAAVAYSESPKTLRADMQELRPTIMLAVPRLFERIEAAIRAEAASAVARRLLDLTVRIGLARRGFEPGGGLGLAGRLFWALAGARIARRIRAAFGGRLRIVLSGGAPLPPETARLFLAAGVPLVEGYGLTEAGPAVTGSRPHEVRPGAAGAPLPGVELAFAGDGEILVRSPSVMRGYWNLPEKTKEALDDDGWLHTGDLGEMREGRLRVTGRKKDLLVLSTGENVSPEPLEAALARDPLVSHVCVIGDGRPFCSAVVALEPRAWAEFARSKALDPEEPGSARATSALLRRLAPLTANAPAYARLRGIVASTEPWTIEGGLMTATLKARRDPVLARHLEEIERLYAEAGMSRLEACQDG